MPPVREYYCGWRPTISLVREAIYELPNGFYPVTINGVRYYYYPYGVYKGRYFRALGEGAGVTCIIPP